MNDAISFEMDIASLGPGDLQTVFECLRGALNQQPVIQKQAEASLSDLSLRSGFCSCLAVRHHLISLHSAFQLDRHLRSEFCIFRAGDYF